MKIELWRWWSEEWTLAGNLRWNSSLNCSDHHFFFKSSSVLVVKAFIKSSQPIPATPLIKSWEQNVLPLFPIKLRGPNDDALQLQQPQRQAHQLSIRVSQSSPESMFWKVKTGLIQQMLLWAFHIEQLFPSPLKGLFFLLEPILRQMKPSKDWTLALILESLSGR